MEDQQNETLNKGNQECHNCSHLLQSDDKYCPSCGQKNTDSILNLREIVSNFLSNTFYLDSKMWSSYGKLLIPAKTTIQYVEGKRKKYIHPFRLFFISAILFFSIFNILASKIIDNTLSPVSIIQEINNKLHSYDRRTKLIDSIGIQDSSTLSAINYVSDLEPSFAVDTILRDTIYPFISMANTGPEDSMEGILKTISNRDLFALSVDEIIEKYEIKGWWTRYNFKQSMRMSKKPAEVIEFLLNNFIWGVFLIVGICSWILKVLFYRRKKTYIEALLLLLEVHTVGFLLGSIGIVIEYLLESTSLNRSIGFSLLLSFIYFIVMIKRFYKEHMLWTLLKSFLFMISYLVIFSIFMTLTSIIAIGFF